MGFKFRKSIKIAPGIRLNLTSKGISSISLGKTGVKVNIGKEQVRATASIPGTGLSYSTSISRKKEVESPKPQDHFKSEKNASEDSEGNSPRQLYLRGLRLIKRVLVR